MGKFITGVIVGILGVGAGAYLYIHYGYIDMRADKSPGALERRLMQGAMDRYADRHAPRLKNPIDPTEANLIDGLRLYKSNCAVCHGGPDKPISEVGDGFNPSAPQFLKDAPDMPANQNFWIISHGIKMTGMPAWQKVMSEADIWKLTTFLGKMDELDKLPPAVQAAWKTGTLTEPGAPQQPANAPEVLQSPPPAAAPEAPQNPPPAAKAAHGQRHKHRH